MSKRNPTRRKSGKPKQISLALDEFATLVAQGIGKLNERVTLLEKKSAAQTKLIQMLLQSQMPKKQPAGDGELSVTLGKPGPTETKQG